MQDALTTGDFSELLHHLERNPEQIESVNRQNIVREYLAEKYPFYPLPSGEELEKLSGPIKMGLINSINQALIFFGLDPDILAMHTMVAGRTGSGKSWYFAFILIQMVLLSALRGFNVFVPDNKCFYRRLLGKVPGLNIITFDNFIFNPLEVPDWMHPLDFVYLFAKKFAADNLLWIPSENLISDALEILFRKKGIFDRSKNYPNLLELYETINNLRNDKTYGPRYRDIFEASLNRFKPYLHIKNLVRSKGISHEVFCTENVVLELPLNKVPDAVHNFLVSWILNLTYSKNITLGIRGDRLHHFNLIDESRTLLNANREHSGFENIEPGINEIFAKGREFEIGLWLGSQEMKSFSYSYKANCFTKICFPLTEGDDVSEIKRSFGLTEEQGDYLYKLAERRMAVCRFAKFERPFIIIVPELHGLEQVPTDKEVEEAMAGFYQEILPKEDAAEIVSQKAIPRFNFSDAEIDGTVMLRHLAQNPFLSYGNLITALNLTPARGDKARAWMVNSGFLVEVHSIMLRRGKPGEYYELTEYAYNLFHGKPPAGKGGFRHKCFCHAIKNSMEEQGFDSQLEAMVGASPKAFDVLAWKKGEGMFGYEVTLHFQNLTKNLRDDLETTVKKVVVVCKGKDDLEKAKTIAKNEFGGLSRLEFKTIFEFTQKD
ncbi:MAG: hypothetical protein ABSB22_11725 [Thermodesulfobacteriota bacterium]